MGREMLRGVYPQRSEWAQHDSAVPCLNNQYFALFTSTNGIGRRFSPFQQEGRYNCHKAKYACDQED
jgi:hypothetical protein